MSKYNQPFKHNITCVIHKLKAKKLGNPMVYQCLRCGKIVKSKKEK